MTTLASIAQSLSDSLQLTQPPVGVAFAEAVPEGVKTYLGSVPAGCRFWQEATTLVFATVPKDHALCSIGMYTHHLEDGPQPQPLLPDRIQVPLQFNELSLAKRTPVGRSEKNKHRSFRATDRFQGSSPSFLILGRKIRHRVSDRRAGLGVLAVKNGKREHTQSA